MIEKYCHYPVINSGFQSIHWIDPREKYLEKLAYPLTPEIDGAVGELEYDPSLIYLLINALGASEYWGQNINADRFYVNDLAHNGQDYGHKTFLNGHVFAHHTNKDPAKGFGKILRSVWNPHMKRVELLVEVDKERGYNTGNGSVIDKLEAGEFTDTSMGTKVPYDLCTLCHDHEKYQRYKETFDPKIHKSVAQAVLSKHSIDPVRGLSRTRDDYCTHLKTMRGKILPDGSQIGMINCFPRFFDISVVFIGADRTSKVMAFFWPPRDNRPKHIIFPEKPIPIPAKTKEASVVSPFVYGSLFGGTVKQAGIDKESDIVKRIATNFRRKLLKGLEEKEIDLPTEELDEALSSIPEMSPEAKLSRLLSSLTSLGIILKRPEFQRVVLISQGKRNLADDLSNEGVVFRSVSECGEPICDIDTNFYRPGIVERFLDYVPSRSFLHPHITKRVVKFRTIIPIKKRLIEDDSAFLDKIAGSYNNYRCLVLDKGYGLLKKAEYAAPDNPKLPYGAIPYLYASKAYRDRKPVEEEEAESFFEKHPWFVATMILGGGLSAIKALRKAK